MALLNQPPPRSVALELVDGAPAPPGAHAAIVYQVIDEFGVERKKFQSEETEIVDLTRFIFAAKAQDGRTVYAATPSMRISGHTKASLYKFLTALMGRAPAYGWDYAELQGSGCVISVEHRPSKNGSRTYVTVASAGPLPPGYPPPQIAPAPRTITPAPGAAAAALLRPPLPPPPPPATRNQPAPFAAPPLPSLTPPLGAPTPAVQPAMVLSGAPATPEVQDDPDDDVPF